MFKIVFLVITAIVSAPLSRPATAADVALPPVNLGDTSFQDAIAFPGWLVEEIVGYRSAGRFNDERGNKISGFGDLSIVSATTHVAYISHVRILGGYYGVETLLPIADIDLNTSFGLKGRERGVGDLIVSPFVLQWTDHRVLGRRYFQRFVFDFTIPTGKYGSARLINIGNNVVSLNPYYAFTIIPLERLEVSGRLHYLWNSESNRPPVAAGAATIQPGQAFHANYAASYRLIKTIRLGVNGYVLQQLTADKINGNPQSNSQERIFAIGPGVELGANRLSLYLNGFFEIGAVQRTQGTKLTFRISRVF